MRTGAASDADAAFLSYSPDGDSVSGGLMVLFDDQSTKAAIFT